jgi:hypothetical protein
MEFLWVPQIKVVENKGQFDIRADLPGLNKKEEINVELKDNSVVISGERKAENKEAQEGDFRSERSYGSFYRRIPLPEGADLNNRNKLRPATACCRSRSQRQMSRKAAAGLRSPSRKAQPNPQRRNASSCTHTQNGPDFESANVDPNF